MDNFELNRRTLLGLMVSPFLPVPPARVEHRFELAAKDAVKWLRAQALITGAGRAWPAIPGKKESQSPDLYSGTAGVALALGMAGSVWKDRALLDEAREGLEEARSWAPQMFDGRFLGLYTGLAGIAYTASALESYGARDLRWTEDPNLDLEKVYGYDLSKQRTALPVNDVISGLAGIGLALIDTAHGDKRKSRLAMADSIAGELVARARPEGEGFWWAMAEGEDRKMPNLSHGTAGVAFFLAKLYSRTRRKAHLEAAVKGANYLLSLANKENDGCLIYHVDPGGLDRYYLGWCHGPAGTAHLWWQLAKATGDSKWSEWALRGANSLLSAGVPAQRTAGYWNNEGLCCGTAGIGRFFLDAYRRTKDRKYISAAEKCGETILEKSNVDGLGRRWSFAENRVAPESTAEQTGWMQGAAGIAAFLIEVAHPGKAVLRLPVDADL